MHEAQHALATVDDSPSLQRAQEALEKGTHLLAERQKLIKIADRSANGWGVVAEYTADELADDSEDEKRLEKAEKAAERKVGPQTGATRGQAFPAPPAVCAVRRLYIPAAAAAAAAAAAPAARTQP